ALQAVENLVNLSRHHTRNGHQLSMKKMKLLLTLATALFTAARVVGADVVSPPPRLVAVKAGHLLDVSGGRTLAKQVLLIQGETIQAVGAEGEVAIPNSAQVVDLSQSWILPGLIDCHTHLVSQFEDYYADTFRKSPIDHAVEAHVFARRTLEAGFTTCRDVGGVEFIDVALKRAINAGKVTGPRLFVAGHILSATGGHGDISGFSPY